MTMRPLSGPLRAPHLPGEHQVWVKNLAGDWKLIEWRGGPRRNLWDMGHITGKEYALLRDRYLSGRISKEEFLERYRDPANYSVEDWLRNQSHVDEKQP